MSSPTRRTRTRARRIWRDRHAPFTFAPCAGAQLDGVTEWQLACIDMAGTTIRDEGLVDQAFTVAVAGEGVAPGTAEYERMRAVVRKTQGQSKIEVFRLLLDGNEER